MSPGIIKQFKYGLGYCFIFFMVHDQVVQFVSHRKVRRAP